MITYAGDDVYWCIDAAMPLAKKMRTTIRFSFNQAKMVVAPCSTQKELQDYYWKTWEKTA